MKKLCVFLVVLFVGSSVLSSDVGVSVHPFEADRDIFGTEFVSELSNGSGVALQARYLYTVTSNLSVDGGVRIGDSKRTSTLFVGSTYELFPDFADQPQVAIRGSFERSRIDSESFYNFGLTPVASKGFSFWGYEAFPYVAVPVKLMLDSDDKDYVIASSLALGISGSLPFEGLSHVTGNVEANVDVDNSYSYLAVGAAMTF